MTALPKYSAVSRTVVVYPLITELNQALFQSGFYLGFGFEQATDHLLRPLLLVLFIRMDQLTQLMGIARYIIKIKLVVAEIVIMHRVTIKIAQYANVFIAGVPRLGCMK